MANRDEFMPISAFDHSYSSEQLTMMVNGVYFNIEYILRKSSGPTLVFLHGLGCRKEDFSRVLELEAFKPYAILTFDVPGCGHSSYGDTAHLTVHDIVLILQKLLDYHRIEDTYIIGHSMGGLVGLLFALQFPNRVRGLASIEGTYVLDSRTMVGKIPDLVFERFLKRYKKIAYSFQRMKDAGMRSYADTLKRITNPRAYYDYGKSIIHCIMNDHLFEQYVSLSCPKLFMYGSKDCRTPLCLLARQSHGLNMAEIPNSSYFPNYDNPNAFYNTLNAWINETERSRS